MSQLSQGLPPELTPKSSAGPTTNGRPASIPPPPPPQLSPNIPPQLPAPAPPPPPPSQPSMPAAAPPTPMPKPPPAQEIGPTKIQLPCPRCKAIPKVPHGLARFNCPQCGVDLAIDLSKVQQFFGPGPASGSEPPLQEPPEEINELSFQHMRQLDCSNEFASSGRRHIPEKQHIPDGVRPGGNNLMLENVNSVVSDDDSEHNLDNTSYLSLVSDSNGETVRLEHSKRPFGDGEDAQVAAKRTRQVDGNLSPFSSTCERPFTASTADEELKSRKDAAVPNDVSNQIIRIGAVGERDYTTEFTIDEVFESKDALTSWARAQGKKFNMVIIILRSDKGGGAHNRRPRIRFGCERHGQYMKSKSDMSNLKSDADSRKRQRPKCGTKKCGCPFALRGVNIGSGDEWKVEVICGEHNHSLSKYPEGHSFAGRLSKKEDQLLVDMSTRLVRPKHILSQIKKNDPSNISTIKTIYNARQRHKVKEKASRTKMQILLPSVTVSDVLIESTLDRLKKWMDRQPDEIKRHVSLKLEELMKSGVTGLSEPLVKVKGRGRPSTNDTSHRILPSTFVSALSGQDSRSPVSSIDIVEVGLQIEKSPVEQRKLYRSRSHTASLPTFCLHTPAVPTSRTLIPPESSHNYLPQIPAFIRQYVMSITDVNADGNCGYRAVASAMEFGEEDWRRVRKDLVKSIWTMKDMYDRVFHPIGRANELLRSLDYFDDRSAPKEYWMVMPEMGLVIATCYRVVVIYLSKQICLTILPLCDVDGPLKLPEIAIAYVNNDHFIQVHLSYGHPMPPVAKQWLDNAHSNARDWYNRYKEQAEQFSPLAGIGIKTEQVIIDD